MFSRTTAKASPGYEGGYLRHPERSRSARRGRLKVAVNATFGHMREPVLFMANILRGLNATLGASSAIYNQATEMGQQLFYPPSVFSYFSPLYRTEKGLLGPEFQIYSTQTAADRADIVHSTLYGTLDKSTTVNLTPFVQQAGTIEILLNYISSVFLHGAMSANLYKAAYTAACRPEKRVGAGAGRALRRSDIGRIPNHPVS